MKVQYNFDTRVPEDRYALQQVQQAGGMYFVLTDLDANLRNKVKYGPDGEEDKLEIYDKVRTLLRELCFDYNVSLELGE